MEFEGIVKKDKKSLFWIAEVKAFDLLTQGDSKENVLFMVKDALLELLKDAFSEKAIEKLSINVYFHNEKKIGIEASNTKLLVALALRRQRERAGISIREVTKRLHVKSPNSYAQYEKGKVNISIDTLDRFLDVLNPNGHDQLRLSM